MPKITLSEIENTMSTIIFSPFVLKIQHQINFGGKIACSICRNLSWKIAKICEILIFLLPSIFLEFSFLLNFSDQLY